MKNRKLVLIVTIALVLMVVGCSSPESKAKKFEPYYDSDDTFGEIVDSYDWFKRSKWEVVDNGGVLFVAQVDSKMFLQVNEAASMDNYYSYDFYPYTFLLNMLNESDLSTNDDLSQFMDDIFKSRTDKKLKIDFDNTIIHIYIGFEELDGEYYPAFSQFKIDFTFDGLDNKSYTYIDEAYDAHRYTDNFANNEKINLFTDNTVH